MFFLIKKRWMLRVAIVAAVVGLGVYALMQANGGVGGGKPEPSPESKAGEADGKKDNASVETEKTDESRVTATPPASDPFAALQAAAAAKLGGDRSSEFRSDNAEKPIVRGQTVGGEFSPARLPAPLTSGSPARLVQESIGTEGADEEFDDPRSLRPTPAKPPARPAVISLTDELEDAVPTRQRADELESSAVQAVNGAADRLLKSANDFGGSPAPRAIAPRSAIPYVDEVEANGQLPGVIGSSARPLPASVNGYAQPEGFTSDTIADASSSPLSTPGPEQLEGLQAPSLAMEKRAPPEIQVGKPASFQIKVQNVGQVDAHEVVVLDNVPRGTRFVDSTPPAQRAPDGSLMWELGTLKPGSDATIDMQLIPLEEGEIGSVARVVFEAQASARTICTRPLLAVEHFGPQRVLIGQDVVMSIKITNPGTGVATGVIIEEDVPEGLSHPAGSELEYEIGTLRPGESREIQLTMKAEKAGVIDNTLLVRGDGNLIEQDVLQLEVIAPRLQVDMAGPSLRFLERQATYTVSVSNPGTAPAKEIELVAYLPKGLKFIESNNEGQYDPQQHAVFWSLEELPPNEAGSVKLTALPIESGEQKLRVEGRADLGLADAREKAVVVEGIAELFFDVADTADPIEVGSDTVYQVRVINQGSKTATNVQIAAELPPGVQPIGGDGPTRSRVQGQVLVFEPLARLAPKEDVLFKIQGRGVAEGEQRVRVQLLSDENRTPVLKEEITRVYLDR